MPNLAAEFLPGPTDGPWDGSRMLVGIFVLRRVGLANPVGTGFLPLGNTLLSGV